ncbi:MAG: CNNM domain-containing protein [Holosporaceae bacterium]|jgi:Mg2+/Co2+ transporter CorB|nr:CNNM domain-containing protein [Holosporaceae bacterium]
MTYLVFILGIVCAIAVAGFISGSETAVTGASKTYLYHLAKRGDARAKKVILLQENMSSSIGTILILNQLVLYLIPVGSTLFAVKYLTGTWAAILQTMLAILLAIYAEILPKMLAIRFTIPFALFVVPLIIGAIKFFKPVVSILEICAKYSIKLARIEIDKEKTDDQSDEELRGAIEMHSSEGDEEARKKSMLKSILDLEEVVVSHIMVHRKNLHTIDASLPMEKIAEELSNCRFSRIPMWKDNPENIIGILKTKTFFQVLQLQNGKFEKIEISNLISTPWFIPETTRLLDQLQNFREKREHFALVVDEYGDLQGCITLEDILEEIVGDIADEYETTLTNGIRLQSDGSVIVDGSAPVRDLNRQFDWNIPEEDAATIAGYLMHEVRKIPDIGQTYVLSDLKIEILRRQRNQIGLVRITPSSKTSQ